MAVCKKCGGTVENNRCRRCGPQSGPRGVGRGLENKKPGARSPPAGLDLGDANETHLSAVSVPADMAG